VTAAIRRLASAEPTPGIPGLGLTVVIVGTIDLVVLIGRRDGGRGTR
jgi:hypothetical protein